MLLYDEISLCNEYKVYFALRDKHPLAEPDGQTPARPCLWVRLVKPKWDSGWHECIEKSQHKASLWWKLIANESDIKEAWALTTGQKWWPPPRYDEIFLEGLKWLNQL